MVRDASIGQLICGCYAWTAVRPTLSNGIHRWRYAGTAISRPPTEECHAFGRHAGLVPCGWRALVRPSSLLGANNPLALSNQTLVIRYGNSTNFVVQEPLLPAISPAGAHHVESVACPPERSIPISILPSPNLRNEPDLTGLSDPSPCRPHLASTTSAAQRSEKRSAMHVHV